MISRRALLASTVLVPLSACQTQPTWENTLRAVVADANAIAALLAGALKQIALLNVPGLTPDVLNIAQSSLAGVMSVAQALSGVPDAGAAQPLVLKLASYASTGLGALAVLPLPPPIPGLLAAAAILVPVVAAAVQLVVPTPTTPVGAPGMTPAQARAMAATSS